MVGNVLSVFHLPPQQKTTIPHLLLAPSSFLLNRKTNRPHLLLTTYSLLSSMAASTIVRLFFENARPMRVSVLPLPANLSA